MTRMEFLASRVPVCPTGNRRFVQKMTRMEFLASRWERRGDGSFVVAILGLHYYGKTQKPLTAKSTLEKWPKP